MLAVAGNRLQPATPRHLPIRKVDYGITASVPKRRPQTSRVSEEQTNERTQAAFQSRLMDRFKVIDQSKYVSLGELIKSDLER